MQHPISITLSLTTAPEKRHYILRCLNPEKAAIRSQGVGLSKKEFDYVTRLQF